MVPSLCDPSQSAPPVRQPRDLRRELTARTPRQTSARQSRLILPNPDLFCENFQEGPPGFFAEQTRIWKNQPGFLRLCWHRVALAQRPMVPMYFVLSAPKGAQRHLQVGRAPMRPSGTHAASSREHAALYGPASGICLGVGWLSAQLRREIRGRAPKRGVSDRSGTGGSRGCVSLSGSRGGLPDSQVEGRPVRTGPKGVAV